MNQVRSRSVVECLSSLEGNDDSVVISVSGQPYLVTHALCLVLDPVLCAVSCSNISEEVNICLHAEHVRVRAVFS